MLFSLFQVWADLAHYKTGCSKLKRELDRRQEELDQLKLQRVLDINTFNGKTKV